MKSYVKVRVIKIILIFLLNSLGGALLFAQELDLENTEVRTGYSIGVNIGLNLASQGILGDDVDNVSLIQGIQDAVDGTLRLSEEEIVAALDQYSTLIEQRADEQLAEMVKSGEDFLNLVS